MTYVFVIYLSKILKE